jgi:hypothetical protein
MAEWIDSIVAWIDYRIEKFDLAKTDDELVVEARAMLPVTTNMLVSDDDLIEALAKIRFAASLANEVKNI